MPGASYTQSSFLGGEFSAAAQGRIDLPEYPTALANSLNGLPLEEGAWTRRSGTWTQGVCYQNQNGQITEFWLTNNYTAIVEITVGRLRVWLPGSLLVPAVYGYSSQASFALTQVTTTAQAQSVRVIQTEDTMFLLQAGFQPKALLCTNFAKVGAGVGPGFVPNFVLETDAGFDSADGPYEDPLPGASQTNNSLGLVSDHTNTPTFSITDSAYVFVAGDVLREIRLWSQPAAWASGTTYTLGDFVSYQGAYWRCLIGGSTGKGIPPGSNTIQVTTTVGAQAWAVAPEAAIWTYGSITSVDVGAQTVVVQLLGSAVPSVNGLVIDTWRLGVYGGADAKWPTCGTYHEGRLWLGGAVPGRFDASTANSLGKGVSNRYAPFFSPTDQFGAVLPNSAISYTVNDRGANNFLWMASVQNSLVMGTAAAEWLVQASVANDAITPTNIQAHVETRYKSRSAAPARAGQALIFIQSFGRRVIEYVVDVFSQRFIGRHLNRYAKHLTTAGVKHTVYQEELAPAIWGVTNDSNLIGCTYRRISRFGQEEPVFDAWHHHTLGSGRTVEWACMGTDDTGTEDVLILLTKNPTDGHCQLEMVRPQFDVDDLLWAAWYLDTALPGAALSVAKVTATGVNIIGLAVYNGVSMRVFMAGIDCGSHLVTAGALTVPFKADPDGLLTAAYLASVSDTGYTKYGLLTLNTDSGLFVPCIVGYPYDSTMTLLRPQTVNQVRTQNGPGVGKPRRHERVAVQFASSVTGPSIEFDGGPSYLMRFVKTDQFTQYDHTALVSGIHDMEVDDTYSQNGQITITTNSPYPMTIASVSGFLNTQDH